MVQVNRSSSSSCHAFLCPLLFLLRCLLLVTGSTSLFAGAGTVDCESYQVQELADICTASTAPVTVHDHLAATGLNAEVESWGSNPGLHILPPQVYVLDSPVKLKPQQFILPHPTVPLPAGKVLRTMELEASIAFSIGNDAFFSLLQLDSEVSAGGMEIHGSKLTDSVAGFQKAGQKQLPRVLVYAPNSLNVVIAGSVLTGRSGLDHLLWNCFQDDFYWSVYKGENYNRLERDTTPGLRVYRNFLETNGTASGVLVTGGHHPPVIENNVLLVSLAPDEANDSSGVRVEKGAAVLRKNDIVYSGPSTGKRRRIGVDVDAPAALTVVLNAFYAPDSEHCNDKDTGVSIRTDSQWMRVQANCVSPLTRLLQVEESSDKKPSLIESDNYDDPSEGAYRFSGPSSFFAFTDDLGATPLPVGFLVSQFNNSNRSNISELQKPGQVSGDSTLTLIDDLIARAGYCPDCPWFINRYDAIGIPAFLTFIVVSNAFIALGCSSLGARHCPACRR